MDKRWLFLIIPAIVFAVLFIFYFFNLDMKIVASIYKKQQKQFDNEKRETSL